MKLVIAKVDEVYFDGEAESLTAPGVEGEMTILGEHMPLVTTLKAGELIVRIKGETDRRFPVEGGVLEVRRDGATVIL
jgi:F-type H+-transporting ATPase subunit epsilon